MPLARYFFFVGGVLLALLFISDAYLPKLPVADRAYTDLPVIRIHSNRKWPAARCLRHEPPDDHSCADREHGCQRPAPRSGRRRLGQGAGAGGICTAATIRCRAATTIQTKNAGAEAATQTQNCEETLGAVDGPGGAATAIWLFWQQHLVSRLTGTPVARRRISPSDLKNGFSNGTPPAQSALFGHGGISDLGRFDSAQRSFVAECDHFLTKASDKE